MCNERSSEVVPIRSDVSETISEYKYTDSFSVFRANTRKCMRETTIDGVTFEEGMNIQVDTWTLHHNPRVWGDDVEDFKPERWENSASEHLEHNGSYIPFGSGPRQCIGMRLAQMEQKILLAQILKEYSFRTTRNTQIPLKLVGKLTLSPESVIVKLEPRKDLL